MSCGCTVPNPGQGLPPGLHIQQYRELLLARQGKTAPPRVVSRPQPVLASPPIRQPRVFETVRKAVPMTWAYGITTVPSRLNDLFPRTLASLATAGFDSPRIFIDGAKDASDYDRFGLETTVRHPAIRTVGNWLLSMGELYIRNPTADRFAIFQDDFVTYKNLRAYLERSTMPEQGYLNLYTFPSNQQLAKGEGWYASNQFGRGAVALVFNRLGVQTLLSHTHMIQKVTDPQRGHKSVDGAIITAMQAAGWKEYVHNPSLVQHTGDVSSMRNTPHPKATSFRGEEFNALELLGC